MKFAVEHVATNLPACTLRIGVISEISRLPGKAYVTPMLLLYSKGGSVAHLTREVLDMAVDSSTCTVQIPLANSAQCYSSVKHFKNGISTFAGLNESLSYCTVQDPAEETKAGYNEKNSVTIWTHTGRKPLTSDKFMDMIEAFRPDMYHVLCDGDTNVESSRKRAQKSVDVSTRMFSECLERHTKSEVLQDSAMLAVIEGGYNVDARIQAAQMLAKHPRAEGFVIDGLHNNGPSVEKIAYKTIQHVVCETLEHLPEDKLRVIHGSWRPDVVLELVRAGIDVFDSSLVYLATERGCAFTFTYRLVPSTPTHCNNINSIENGFINGPENIKEAIEADEPKLPETVKKSCDSNNYQININEKIYFDDLTPLMSDCKCLTCSKHTRAYIHHLLNTREMLASVLLMIHNLHHYEHFFQAIRDSGKEGQFLMIDPSLS